VKPESLKKQLRPVPVPEPNKPAEKKEESDGTSGLPAWKQQLLKKKLDGAGAGRGVAAAVAAAAAKQQVKKPTLPVGLLLQDAAKVSAGQPKPLEASRGTDEKGDAVTKDSAGTSVNQTGCQDVRDGACEKDPTGGKTMKEHPTGNEKGKSADTGVGKNNTSPKAPISVSSASHASALVAKMREGTGANKANADVKPTEKVQPEISKGSPAPGGSTGRAKNVQDWSEVRDEGAEDDRMFLTAVLIRLGKSERAQPLQSQEDCASVDAELEYPCLAIVLDIFKPFAWMIIREEPLSDGCSAFKPI
jgi:hypothetical protein